MRTISLPVCALLCATTFFGACKQTPDQPSDDNAPAAENTAPEEAPAVEPEPQDEELDAQLLAIEFDCPVAEVTVTGEPLEVVSALAWRIETEEEVVGDFVMLTDEDITCSVIMDHGYTPERQVTAFASGVNPEFNSVRNRNHTETGAYLQLAEAAEEAGERQVICVPDVVAIEGLHNQEFSAIGLFIGEFCGTMRR